MSVRKPTTKRKSKISGIKKFKPKIAKKLASKALRKNISGKLGRGVNPAFLAYMAYGLGMPAINKSSAKAFGEKGLSGLNKSDYTPEHYEFMKEYYKNMDPKEYRATMKGFYEDVKTDTKKRKAYRGGPFRPYKGPPTELDVDAAKTWKDMYTGIVADTKKRKAYRGGPYKKRSLPLVKRKKSGRVGRPIGVGVAERGFGKAMKNG
tara:strand:+ start:223 stop:840 length:618 start_codon:yes stop_codon:yes gene_type:complete